LSLSDKSDLEDIYKGCILDEDYNLISHIPIEYLDKLKISNYIKAREEERKISAIVSTNPYKVIIEPTNACNLKCPLCPTGLGLRKRNGGKISLANYKKIIDILAPYTMELYLQNWGEPTLLSYLPELIKYASKSGIMTHVSTNFSIKYEDDFLRELMTSGLTYLQIDYDGLTDLTYKKYRVGGDFTRVNFNIKKSLEIKRQYNLDQPYVELKMMVMSHNEHEVEKLFEVKQLYGVDSVTTGNIQINPNILPKWIPASDEYIYKSYSDYSNHKAPQCHWLWSGIVINWDGGISPCCIVDDPNSDFGNILEENVSDIWNNKMYQSARSEFSSARNITEHTICNDCKNDTHNPKLERVGDSFAIKIK